MTALVTAPLLLAAVLVAASVAKWNARDSLVSATQLLRLPAVLNRPVRWLPPIELALAIALVVAPVSPAFIVVSAAVLALMLAYTAVVARGLTFDPRPSCGCFGAVGSPITGDTLARNVVLSGLAAVSIGWGVAGWTVPGALADLDATDWAWLGALIVTAAVVRWVVRERAGLPPKRPVSAAPAEASDIDDYQRAPIPPLMVLQDGTPTTLAALARTKAQLLIWVTCGCGGTRSVVDQVDRWREAAPAIDIQLVSTMSEGSTEATYPEQKRWLYDLHGQALASLGGAYPAALLLGADGLLAGGPVFGEADVTDLAEAVIEQLSGAHLPDASESVPGEIVEDADA